MVKSTKLRLTYLQEQILRVLFIYSGKSLNQRQLAIKTSVSQPAIIKALPLIEKLGYITVSKDAETKRIAISLNTGNHKIMQFKRIDNLKQLYESGLVDFFDQTFAGATIILFGSYSRGDDTINSDIDIAIIGRKQKRVDLKQFEDLLKREINCNFYGSFDKIHIKLKENLANGIILTGGFTL